MSTLMRNWEPERIKAHRKLYAKARRLQAKGLHKDNIAVLCKTNPSRIYEVLRFPPMSERERKAFFKNEGAAHAAQKVLWAKQREEWRAERVRNAAEWLEKQRLIALEEAQETHAQSFDCLINALIEMRPYLPKPGDRRSRAAMNEHFAHMRDTL